MEQWRLPLGGFPDALRPELFAVVFPRVEVAGTPSADVQPEAAVRRRWDLVPTSDVEGNCSDHPPLRGQRVASMLGRFENCVNQRVVTDVRPGMVHVEDGNVELGRIRGWKRPAVQAHVFEEIVFLMDIASFHRQSESQTVLGLGNDEVHDVAKIVPLLVDRELTVGAGAVLGELARVIDLLP